MRKKICEVDIRSPISAFAYNENEFNYSTNAFKVEILF